MTETGTDWRDRVVGDRMAVDRDFGPQVEQSRFSRQEWGLIMTATEFEIEHPGDPERARIVADTTNVPAILPEFENLAQGMAGMGSASGSGSTGFLAAVKNALGLGGGSTPDEGDVEAATELTTAYAAALQARLEDQGRWEEIRAVAEEA